MKERDLIKIDFLKIAEGLIHRLWIIIISMLLCGVLMFSCAAFWITPKYESSVLMYVNNSSFSVGATNFSISSSEISAAKSLVETYLVILNTRSTLNDVIRQGGLNCSVDDLRDMISAASVNETEVFSINVTCADPQLAERIANTIAQVLPEKIADIVEGSSVRIVDHAVVSSERVSPIVSRYTILGLLIGLVISCAAITVYEVLDNRIHSESYLLENYANISLLTVVPDLLDDRSRKGYYYYEAPEDDDGEGKSAKRRGNR